MNKLGHWARKVKIHLSSITREQINEVSADPGKVLFASYEAQLLMEALAVRVFR